MKRIAQVMEERLHATRLQLMNVYESILEDQNVAASMPLMVPEALQVYAV